MGAALDPDLRTTLAAAPLERDVVTVRGEDALAYLQGQLSQDVEALAVGDGAPALLLAPTGKVVAWVRATRTADDEVALDADPGAGAEVLARLRRFLLRTKAELDLATWSGVALRGPGALAAAVPAPPGGLRAVAAWPGVEGVDLVGPDRTAVTTGDLPAASTAALEALRVECGVPAWGAEVTEATIPAELGQWLIDASVSFTKGCYAGQELVARIDSRGGNVPRPLRGLVVDAGGEVAPMPGVAVLDGGTEVGAITSSAVSATLGPVALAPLPRSLAVGARVVLGDGAGATVAELPLR